MWQEEKEGLGRGLGWEGVKGENVAFDSDAANATVKLIDFGTGVALEGQGEQVKRGKGQGGKGFRYPHPQVSGVGTSPC